MTDAVECLWFAVVDVMWKLWICFAVIVFVYVKFEIRSSSVAFKKERKPEALNDARLLMEAKKLREAEAVLQRAVLLAGEESDSNVEAENQASVVTQQLGQLHEMKSLCLFHLGDVISSMVEMDKTLRTVSTFDADLMNSANCCFQLFYRWCRENFDHFREDIVRYHDEKKKYLKTAFEQKKVQPSLLLESIHSFLLSEFLAKNESVDGVELSASKELCHSIYNLVRTEG